MKIYVLKIKKDYCSEYNGLDDIIVECFTTIAKAKKKMDSYYEDAKIFFSEAGIEEEDYCENELDEDSFHINDGCDYFSAHIVEKELID